MIKSFRTLSILVLLIAVLSGFAASMGIFFESGSGPYEITSMHGQKVVLSGKGLYRDMPADVAIQGQAQDYITLFLAIPFVLIMLYRSRFADLRSVLLLSGTLGYFLLTYVFYLNMAAFNQLFLVYAALAGLSFFAFYLSTKRINREQLISVLSKSRKALPGWVLIIIPVMIGMLWLNIVLPPLADGTIYPKELQNFTTLIVQGNDLGLMLPISFVLGVLYLKRRPDGLVFAPVYLVFLCFLMLALIAKIVGMSATGVPVGPAIIIIPVFWLISLTATWLVLKKV